MSLRALGALGLAALVALGLVHGVGGGLARLGAASPLAPTAALDHGAWMIGVFFGAVISVERAVALKARWAWLAPLAAGLAGPALLLGQGGVARGLLVLASGVLTLGAIRTWVTQPAAHTLTLGLGAACWAAGCSLWAAGLGPHQVGLWWVSFLVLTIAGERLELTRLRPPSLARVWVFAGLVVAILLACAAPLAWPALGWRALGAGLAGLALWLGVQDIARRTAREPGLTGFIGRALLAGYAWLGVGGLLLAAPASAYLSRGWDAGLHAVTLGFVVSMVFGHAPLILPAVTGLRVPFSARLYAPLGLLHAAVALRVLADLAPWPAARVPSGWAAAGALALFAATVGAQGVLGRRARRL